MSKRETKHVWNATQALCTSDQAQAIFGVCGVGYKHTFHCRVKDGNPKPKSFLSNDSPFKMSILPQQLGYVYIYKKQVPHFNFWISALKSMSLFDTHRYGFSQSARVGTCQPTPSHPPCHCSTQTSQNTLGSHVLLPQQSSMADSGDTFQLTGLSMGYNFQIELRSSYGRSCRTQTTFLDRFL